MHIYHLVGAATIAALMRSDRAGAARPTLDFADPALSDHPGWTMPGGPSMPAVELVRFPSPNSVRGGEGLCGGEPGAR